MASDLLLAEKALEEAERRMGNAKSLMEASGGLGYNEKSHLFDQVEEEIAFAEANNALADLLMDSYRNGSNNE